MGTKFIYTVLTRYGDGKVTFWSHNCTIEYARGIRKNLANAKYRVRYFKQKAHHPTILASNCEECKKEGARIARLMALIDYGDDD